MVKMNVMRLLDAAHIAYETGTYEVDESGLSGNHATDLMGVGRGRVYRTLVLKGEEEGCLMCCVPVNEELDFKEAARTAEEKKVEMIRVKGVSGTADYIHDGCSPVGMKKRLPTYIEEIAQFYGTAMTSAGQKDVQVTLSLEDLRNYVEGQFASPCLNGWLILQ